MVVGIDNFGTLSRCLPRLGSQILDSWQIMGMAMAVELGNTKEAALHATIVAADTML